MLFNSFAYALFLPVVFIIYWSMPDRHRWVWLLAASCYFYMSWNPRYIILIIGVTLISYASALIIERTQSRTRKKAVLWAGGIVCLSFLFVFKYFNLFAGTFSTIMSGLCIPVHPVTLDLLLPVGISFYTFQTLSYMIDVYRGDISAEKNLGIYATFVSFFPQLVAGPIERAGNLLPQLTEEKRFDYKGITRGLKLIAWGLLKKMCVADLLAVQVDAVYQSLETCTGGDLLFAVIGFSIQIYCDFSGYSDIAVGSANILGINLMNNFSSPYYSASVREFWSRWHISLSGWFRDYVYIPLGGNRCGKFRHSFNLMCTFLLSGLWHGASWTFVVWGGIHGLAQILENTIEPYIKNIRTRRAGSVVSVLFVFSFCSLAWVFFRAETFRDAVYVLTHIGKGFSQEGMRFHNVRINAVGLVKLLLLCGILAVYDFADKRNDVIEWIGKRKAAVRWSIYTALVFIIFLFAQIDENSFIYFQF